MEGFEIINKYNERCLAWRSECAMLLAEWATAGKDNDPVFQKTSWTYCGVLSAEDNTVRGLLEAMHHAKIEYVVTLLRLLRARNGSAKPACNFCTRFTEKGEHVPGCPGGPSHDCHYVAIGALKRNEGH